MTHKTQAQVQEAVEAVAGKLEWSTGSRSTLITDGNAEPVSEVKARINPEQYRAIADNADKFRGISVSLFRKRVRVVAAVPPAPKPKPKPKPEPKPTKPKPKPKPKAAKKATAGNTKAAS